MAAALLPLNSIIKYPFGLGEGDDFDSEPTSVLDLTQCISPPLQPAEWVEQQQQAAIWELNVWQQQHQQNLQWEYQLREEQQLWEEQQLQSMWEQNESDMQYLYENEQILGSCDEVPTSYQSLDGCKFQQQVQEQQQSSGTNSQPSIDEFGALFKLDGRIPWSGNSDSLPSPTNTESDSSAYLVVDGPRFPEFDCQFQSESYEVGSVEDENCAKFPQLVKENLDVTYSWDISSLHNKIYPWAMQAIEDPLYQIHHEPSLVPQLEQFLSRDHPYPLNPADAGTGAAGGSDTLDWFETKVTTAVTNNCEKGGAEANSEHSVTGPSHHQPPSSSVGIGTPNNYAQTGVGTSDAAAQGNSTASRDAEEDCLSIISTVTSATKPSPPSVPAPPSQSNNKSAAAAPGPGRVVTLAELASGGVKMGRVQLPNVGTQIPSVIRLAVETQATAGMGGVRMVQLLLACAEAVACRDSRQANILLQQLQHMATPYGDAMQRITACFVEGLTARLAITGSQPFKFSSLPPGPPKPPSEIEKVEGFRLVYRVSPFLAFGHLAANSAILEAFEKEDKLHIVDLGMSHALQWPYLIHDLANRAGGPPRSLRITGFGLQSAQLKEAGEELVQIAKARNIQFEFRAVTESLENMQRSMLELREGEALAVNSVLQLHCVVKESRGSLNAVLQTIHELSPKILTLVEQDASHNGPFFLGRFMEALHYYSAIFDSLDVVLPRNCPHRVKMEQFHFAEEIKNIVSCEGPARVERHERVDQWRRKMSRAGFQPLPLKFLSQARMWLSHYNCDGYTLSEEKGCLVMGWKGKPIIAASSWKR